MRRIPTVNEPEELKAAAREFDSDPDFWGKPIEDFQGDELYELESVLLDEEYDKRFDTLYGDTSDMSTKEFCLMLRRALETGEPVPYMPPKWLKGIDGTIKRIPTVNEPEELKAIFREFNGDPDFWGKPIEDFQGDELYWLEYILLGEDHTLRFGSTYGTMPSLPMPLDEFCVVLRRALETGVPYEGPELPEGAVL